MGERRAGLTGNREAVLTLCFGQNAEKHLHKYSRVIAKFSQSVVGAQLRKPITQSFFNFIK
jgi:hypothetical protein